MFNPEGYVKSWQNCSRTKRLADLRLKILYLKIFIRIEEVIGFTLTISYSNLEQTELSFQFLKYLLISTVIFSKRNDV